MYTYRIKVFHVTYGNAVAVTVTHYLILNLLPAGDTSLNQNLTDTGKTKSVGKDFLKLLLVMRDSTAGTTKCICWSEHNRITDLIRKCHTIFNILYKLGRRTWLTDALHQILKLLTSLCVTDRLCCCSEKLYIMTVQKAGFCEFHTKIQTSLSTHVWKQTVRLFYLNNMLKHLNGQRLNINLIGDVLIGHDRCRIGIDKDNLHSLFLQRTACLCSRIVKLGRLSDNDRTGTNY